MEFICLFAKSQDLTIRILEKKKLLYSIFSIP